MMTQNNMEVTLRNKDTKRLIKETHLINLKPVAFGIAALLLVIYLITSRALALPKQKLNNVIDNYNDEVIVEMNDLAGGKVK